MVVSRAHTVFVSLHLHSTHPKPFHTCQGGVGGHCRMLLHDIGAARGVFLRDQFSCGFLWPVHGDFRRECAQVQAHRSIATRLPVFFRTNSFQPSCHDAFVDSVHQVGITLLDPQLGKVQFRQRRMFLVEPSSVPRPPTISTT